MVKIIRKHETIIAVLSLTALILGAIASALVFTRLDMTKSKTFTLSSTTKKLRKELPDELKITYYRSKSLAVRHQGPGLIEDFLDEFKSDSNGKISVKVLDPTKNPSEAEGFGLISQQLRVREESEQRVAQVYSGIVLEYNGRSTSLPFVISTETLEYEMVKAIQKLVFDKTTVVGLLSGDSEKALTENYQYLIQSLYQSGYDIREVVKGQKIDDNINVLYVLGNSSLDDYDARFIDEYIMRGGAAFFAVRTVDVSTQYGLQARVLENNSVINMLSGYGINLKPQLVLDSKNITVPFQIARQGSSSYQIQYVRYPHWIIIDEANVNKEHPLGKSFNGLDLFWANPIEINPKDGIEYSEIAHSSKNSWLQTKTFATSPEEQGSYEAEKELTSGTYLTSCSASGKFSSAFIGQALPVREGAGEAPLPSLEKSPENRIIVVSSSDFISDIIQMSNSSFNISFALSSLDWLSSSDELIAMRTKAEVDTRLNKIDDEAVYLFMIMLTYFIILGLTPLAVIIFGVIRSRKRIKLENESREHHFMQNENSANDKNEGQKDE